MAVLVVSLLAMTALAAQQALAAPAVLPFPVTSTVDDIDDNPGNGLCHTDPLGPAAGLCTLRAAVMEANRTSGPGANIMLPAGIYTLTISADVADNDNKGDLNLTTPASGNPLIMIIGAGAGSTIIDGQLLDRVFHVESGRTATISGVTIRGGNASSGGSGGGILNFGSLTVSNTTIRGNSAVSSGGGIRNEGTLVLTNSTLSLNDADTGGGISNRGPLTLIQSTIGGNTAGYGGGISNGGPLTVIQSTISDNFAILDGGGINNAGSLFLVNSTLSGNNADGDGGGIFNAFTANVYNTTILGNGADFDRDVNGGSAGGVYNFSGATFNLLNTLIAGNTVGNAPVYDECTGTLNSYGRNLIGLSGEGGLCTVNQITGGGHPPLNSQYTLGPSQNNGGPTWTIALLRGSNAIDAGDPNSGCTDYNGDTIPTDQRGAARAVDGNLDGVARCDIGAYEYRPPLYLPLIRQ